MSGIDLKKATQILRFVLEDYDGFWCVAGGWAVDLFLGRQTREHEDLEIITLRSESDKMFKHFRKFNPKKIFSGESPQYNNWQGEAIEEEVIQMRLDPVESVDFDLLLTPSEGEQWICRRDDGIRRPLSQTMIMTSQGLPVLAPEIVLLFKAKYLRAKDQQDYESLLPALAPLAREWLSKSLGKIHPGHPWI